MRCVSKHCGSLFGHGGSPHIGLSYFGGLEGRMRVQGKAA